MEINGKFLFGIIENNWKFTCTDSVLNFLAKSQILGFSRIFVIWGSYRILRNKRAGAFAGV